MGGGEWGKDILWLPLPAMWNVKTTIMHTASLLVATNIACSRRRSPSCVVFFVFSQTAHVLRPGQSQSKSRPGCSGARAVPLGRPQQTLLVGYFFDPCFPYNFSTRGGWGGP